MNTQNITDRFNLIDSPWLPVQKLDEQLAELSLRELFREGYSIRRLTSEDALTDTALLGLLETIFMRAIFRRFDEDEEFDFGTFTAAKKKAWLDSLREESPANLDFVMAYLDTPEIYSRFNLFDPKRPFMQVADLHTSKGSFSPISRIIFDSESDHFSVRAAEGKSSLSCAEAARYTVTAQVYDYSGIKSGAVGDPRVKGGRGYPIGTGWYGATGKVILHGENIVETLLLNLPVTRLFTEAIDDDGCSYFQIEDDLPVWEREEADTAAQRPSTGETVIPTGACDALTWQTRRIRLFPEGDRVTGVLVSNGDKISDRFIDAANRFDPWTSYRYSKSQSKKDIKVWMPLQHSAERTLWKGAEALLALSSTEGGSKEAPIKPETVADLNRYFPLTMKVSVQLVGAVYGTQNSVIETTINERLPIELALLTEQYPEHRAAIVENIQKTKDAAAQLGGLAWQLLNAASAVSQPRSPDGKGKKETVHTIETKFRDWLEYTSHPQDKKQEIERAWKKVELTLYALEGKFRAWASQISHDSSAETVKRTWQETAHEFYALKAEELVQAAGTKATIGTMTKDGQIINAAGAQMRFNRELKKIFTLVHTQPEKEGDHA